MKKVFVLLCVLITFMDAKSIYAELTKSDIGEIRTIIREEVQHLDKRIDELRKDMREDINGVRGEINSVRGEIRDVRGEMKDFLLWGFGVTFAGIFALVGFVLWDRRTALSPAIRKNKELEEKEEKIEHVLREYAMKEPKMAEILKQIGLL